MNTCAAPGCDEKVSSDFLCCKPHWYKIPKDLRDEVWDAWRNVHRDRQTYLEVRQRAVEYLGANPLKPKQRTLL